MKPVLAALALAATLITGCGAAMATDIGPAPVSEPDYLKPTGAAVAPEYTGPQRPFPAVKADLSTPPADHAWEPDVPVINPDEYDPDEGETIDPAELAEINEPAEDDPAWNCYIHGNRICGPALEGLAVEAWDKFDASKFPAATLAQAFKVTYHGTVKSGADLPPSKWYTVASSKAGINHAFSVETGVTK